MPREYRYYEVSVSTTEGTETYHTESLSRSGAISQARQWYQLEFAPDPLPATYRAKLDPDYDTYDD